MAAADSLFAFDRALGARYVVGCDEAGRGCMAGPIVAAAVRFDLARLSAADEGRLAELDDSKKLSAAKRAALLPVVWEVADAWCDVVISAETIDRDGLHVCNIRALCESMSGVTMPGAVNLVDGFQLKTCPLSHRRVVRGDQTSAAIAAASIIAKETRDRLMCELDALYPGYGFAGHAGYITRSHEQAVRELGPSPVHRLSFNCKAYAEHRTAR